MESLSGMIKIPSHLLKSVLDKSHEILLSWAYHTTRLDHTVEKHHITIIKLLNYYGIKPLENYQLKNDFIVKVDDSDLPKSYFNFASNRENAIRVFIDTKTIDYLGYFGPPNRLGLCVRYFYNVLSDTTADEDRLSMYMSDIDSTVEHELTHFVQSSYLHKYNSGKIYDLKNFNRVQYYTSQIEFDPTIKSELRRFAMLVVDTYGDNHYNINSLIRGFTGQKSDSSVGDSIFFQVLKLHKPDMYKKALQIFVPKVQSEIEAYKKFKHDVKNTEVDRLDYAFGKLRLNQFSNFVRAINTFIANPESRLADYGSMEKYLDKVPAEYKQTRKNGRLFVRCNEKAIKTITEQNKAFAIETIFVEDDVHNTGLMFTLPELPMILDIYTLTRDLKYIEACEENEINYLVSKEAFAIIDGRGFKFSKKNLIGVYINNEKVG